MVVGLSFSTACNDTRHITYYTLLCYACAETVGLGLILGSCLPTHPHLSEGGDWGPTSFTGLDLILLSPRQAFNL